jgi:hypothetical protein
MHGLVTAGWPNKRGSYDRTKARPSLSDNTLDRRHVRRHHPRRASQDLRHGLTREARTLSENTTQFPHRPRNGTTKGLDCLGQGSMISGPESASMGSKGRQHSGQVGVALNGTPTSGPARASLASHGSHLVAVPHANLLACVTHPGQLPRLWPISRRQLGRTCR